MHALIQAVDDGVNGSIGVFCLPYIEFAGANHGNEGESEKTQSKHLSESGELQRRKRLNVKGLI